jgi:hypothetical protein
MLCHLLGVYQPPHWGNWCPTNSEQLETRSALGVFICIHLAILTHSFPCAVSISALVLAQKVWDDTPLINADFSILYPALTVKEINFLERKFLDLLEFKVHTSE